MSLVPVDPRSEASVVTLLERAASWLSEAVHRGDPADIAVMKAQIATAAEATKQLNLSKDIQLDAQEMVRRAEYALGRAIRKGQVEGTVAKQGTNMHSADLVDNKVYDFVTPSEWHGNRAAGATGISELAASPLDEFDAAVTEAKAEGNLSRANVVRKIKGQHSTHITRDQRAALITSLANQGYSSRQMPTKVGVTEETVRLIAREYDIDIPADRSVAKTRRINSTQIVVNTATALEGLLSGVELIDYDALDLEEVGLWVASLEDSTKKLARFARDIRKATQ